MKYLCLASALALCAPTVLAREYFRTVVNVDELTYLNLDHDKGREPVESAKSFEVRYDLGGDYCRLYEAKAGSLTCEIVQKDPGIKISIEGKILAKALFGKDVGGAKPKPRDKDKDKEKDKSVNKELSDAQKRALELILKADPLEMFVDQGAVTSTWNIDAETSAQQVTLKYTTSQREKL